MAVGSGIGSQFGAAAETVYGTYVAPTRFPEARSFNIKKVQNAQPLTGIAAGRPAPAEEVVTSTAATANLQMDVPRKGFGLFLAHLMGSSTAPVQQAATAAYLQSHSFGDNFGKSLTLQAGLPNVAGTVLPVTALGAKILSAEFTCGVDEVLATTLEFDAKTYSEANPLAAASYTTGNSVFGFPEMGLKLGAFGSEAAVQGVRKVTVNIARPQATDRFYAGGGGTKSEPIWNDYAAITGSIEIDLVNKADFLDRFTGHTSTSLVWEFVGPTAIASTYFPTFRITLPKVYFGGETPEVGGPDVLKTTVPFSAFYDLSNGLAKVEYMSTDLAL